MYLFKKTVYNCKRATTLSLKKEEGKISLRERLELGYHLLYCVFCRRFIRQSRQINLLGKELHRHLEKDPPFTLSPLRKEQIQKEIEKEDR